MKMKKPYYKTAIWSKIEEEFHIVASFDDMLVGLHTILPGYPGDCVEIIRFQFWEGEEPIFTTEEEMKQLYEELLLHKEDTARYLKEEEMKFLEEERKRLEENHPEKLDMFIVELDRSRGQYEVRTRPTGKDLYERVFAEENQRIYPGNDFYSPISYYEYDMGDHANPYWVACFRSEEAAADYADAINLDKKGVVI